MSLLLREAIGDTIRRARTERRRTLRDVSGEARVSLGYLSEIERGRKEPSSELLAAICEALSLSLPELLDDVADALRPAPVAPPRLVAAGRRAPLPAAGVDAALRTAVEEAIQGGAGEDAGEAAGAGETLETGEAPQTGEPGDAEGPGEATAALAEPFADPAGPGTDGTGEEPDEAEEAGDGSDDRGIAGPGEGPGTVTVRLVAAGPAGPAGRRMVPAAA